MTINAVELSHEKLDRAVLAAYAATDPEGGWSEDWAKVWTDTGAGQPLPPNHPLAPSDSEWIGRRWRTCSGSTVSERITR